MTTRIEEVLQALRSKKEYEENGWGVVYLDNAKPAWMVVSPLSCKRF